MLEKLGGGSGGSRPKSDVGFAADGTIRAGDAADGDCGAGGSKQWIVKFPADTDPADIGPMEEAYAQMARAAKIDMAETRLMESEKGPGHFATRRFDRPGEGGRIHMVSLGGLLEASQHYPSIEYSDFLEAVSAVTRDVRDVEKAFRRMVFNVLANNRDDHARQHAFLMDEAGDWHLSPAYDLTYAKGPGGEHYMAVMGEGRYITRQHVERLASQHRLKQEWVNQVIDEVRPATADWPQWACEAGVTHSQDEITLARRSAIRTSLPPGAAQQA